MKRILTLLLFFGLSIPVYSQAQSGKPSYSLRECIETALTNNPEIKLSNTQVSTASAQLTSAFGAYLPSVNFNWGYSRQLNADGGKTINVGGQTINVGSTDPNSFNMSAIASINIFDGFSREYAYSTAKNNLDAQYLNIKNTIQKTYMNVYRQYVEVVKNMQIVKVRKDNLELGKKFLERLKARFEAGTTQKTLVYSQEAENGNREFELITAENTLNISKSALLLTMGLTPEAEAEFQITSLPEDISESERNNFMKAIGTYNDAIKNALENRPDYQSARLSILAAKSNISAAYSTYYPSLGASGGWSWSNNKFNDFNEFGRSFVGLNLSVPIFDNFTTNLRVETSKMQLMQAELQQFQIEQSIKGNLKTAYYNIESAVKQLEVSQRALKSAELNYESINESIKVGIMTPTDLMVANSTMISAQINRINAVYSYFIAQKDILFTIGQINQ